MKPCWLVSDSDKDCFIKAISWGIDPVERKASVSGVKYEIHDNKETEGERDPHIHTFTPAKGQRFVLDLQHWRKATLDEAAAIYARLTAAML